MKYTKQIEEIHSSFLTAGDKLLASALEVINQTGQSTINKAERLKSIGFVQSSDVKKVESIKVSMEVAELVEKYRRKYINNKFITEDQVRVICKKYALECAPISRYRGFVPDVKLKMIEDFKNIFKDESTTVRITNVKFQNASLYSREIWAIQKANGSNIYKVNKLEVVDRRPIYMKGASGIAKTKSYDIINDGLCICAPKKDLDLKGLKKIGAMFSSLTHVVTPDPVVLQPVEGGFLIVAAWGDEASDPLVVNTIEN